MNIKDSELIVCGCKVHLRQYKSRTPVMPTRIEVRIPREPPYDNLGDAFYIGELICYDKNIRWSNSVGFVRSFRSYFFTTSFNTKEKAIVQAIKQGRYLLNDARTALEPRHETPVPTKT